MAAVIILIIIWLCIHNQSNKKKGNGPKKDYSKIAPKKKSEKELKDELLKTLVKSIEIKVTTTPTNDVNNSVIDVTGYSYNLNPNNLKKSRITVPAWIHHYVYNYEEINVATNEQKSFYLYFKESFLKGEYFNLEGNTNYAFILLFDLINDYTNHKNIQRVEQQLEELGKCYPKTKVYAVTSLIKKLRQIGDDEAITKLKNQQSVGYSNYQTGQYPYDGNYWGLGTKYKSKLNLNDSEVKILNKLLDTTNKFSSIEYCTIELIKMFLATIQEVEKKFEKENTSFEEQSNIIAAIEASKHYRYKSGSYNFKSVTDYFINTIHQAIYKTCENKLRDHLNVGRKINLNIYIHSDNALLEFQNRFITQVDKILETEIMKLSPTDETTEISLNEYNRSRWKDIIEGLELNFNEANIQDYISAIHKLEKENKLNPSIENIFFQASKFLSKFNKVEALKLYVQYISYDLKSEKFDNKSLPKISQKNLFKNDAQLAEFNSIVNELIKDKDTEKAINLVSKLYIPKRKKIQLDGTAIKAVDEKYSNTVSVLNEYLQDEDENSQQKELANDSIKIGQNTEINNVIENSELKNTLGLNTNQLDLLELFPKNGFTLNQQQIEGLAKSKGIFKNQLVESINDACYEKLDDLLIEEDEENYIIDENNYQKIFLQ